MNCKWLCASYIREHTNLRLGHICQKWSVSACIEIHPCDVSWLAPARHSKNYWYSKTCNTNLRLISPIVNRFAICPVTNCNQWTYGTFAYILSHHVFLTKNISFSIVIPQDFLRVHKSPSVLLMLAHHGYRSWLSTYYHQISNIRGTLVGNKFVDHSDVVGASPVGAAPTTSSFST